MVWQDIAIAVINILTGYALIPQVYQGFKNKVGAITLQTSIITTITLFSFAIVFATLNMMLSATISTFNGILWALLLIQRIIFSNTKS
jgi:hypothetical protein